MNGGFFDGTAHAFDLVIGPGVVRFGQAVIDTGLGAGEIEGVSPELFAAGDDGFDFDRGRAHVPSLMKCVPLSVSTLCILQGLDQAAQDVSTGTPRCLFMHFDECELGHTIGGHKHVRLAILGSHLDDVDVDVAGRVFHEPLFRFVALDDRQQADVMALEQSV